MGKRWVAGVMIGVFALATLVACAEQEEGTEPSPNYDVLIASGKKALAEDESAQAITWFREADRLRPGDAEANLGIAIGLFVQYFNLIDELITTLGSLGAKSATVGDEKTAFIENPDNLGSGDTIVQLIGGIFDEPLNEAVNACTNATADEDAVFSHVRSIPVNFSGGSILTFAAGDWDREDILLMESVSRLLRGLEYWILSTDLNFDASILLVYLSLDADAMGAANTQALLQALNDILHDSDYPNFLLEGDLADARMPVAGIDLGYFFADLADAVRGAGNPDAFMRYIDFNGDRTHQLDEPYQIADLSVAASDVQALIPTLLVIADAMNASLWDGTELDLDPDNPNYFDLALFNALFTQLGLGFLHIDSIQADLGGYFQRQEFGALRTILTFATDCLVEDENILNGVVCIVGGLDELALELEMLYTEDELAEEDTAEDDAA
ncbi:MAG: hypothetical protein H6684_03160 [Deltaproteobacteria bacterium]|nr:hypothetical protein [Deltaproteobacteria bacterium]MCB9487713.1 hypothetical protein [Deltaproteobacteria bacterium]